jgi:hypothetical protein
MRIPHKYLLFFSIIISLFISGVSTSQTWPIPGAQWQYCNGSFGGYTLTYAYTKDTLINSINYQVIEHISVPPNPNFGAIYTRYSNDTVYRSVGTNEYPFLIFNASIGTIYTTFRTDRVNYSDSSCRSILPVKVIQLDTVNFGTLTLKQWILEDTLYDDIYNGAGNTPQWRVIERIGFLNNFPFTSTTITDSSCNIATDMENGKYILYTYSDSGYSYNGPFCNSVNIKEDFVGTKINIYPNPVNEVLNISGIEEGAQIKIFNVYGQKVYQQILFKENPSVNIQRFPIGFYFLECSNSDNQFLKPFTITR